MKTHQINPALQGTTFNPSFLFPHSITKIPGVLLFQTFLKKHTRLLTAIKFMAFVLGCLLFGGIIGALQFFLVGGAS
jgi:hypothetical protein